MTKTTKTIDALTLRRQLSHILDRVRDGETLTVTRRGAQIVNMAPVEKVDEVEQPDGTRPTTTVTI